MLTFEGLHAPVTTVPGADAVPVVSWPAGADERRRLAAARRPRVLVISPGAPPPRVVDALEDWVRYPADTDELRLRQRTLQRRWLARRGDLWLDEHGLVHRDHRWVALPEAQAAVAAPLIANLGYVVRRDEVRRAYEEAVGERPENAFTGLLCRLQPKLAELGVALHRLSGGRLLLELCSSPTRARAET
jgi:hypothetical protein